MRLTQPPLQPWSTGQTTFAEPGKMPLDVRRFSRFPTALWLLALPGYFALANTTPAAAAPFLRHTTVSIVGEEFFINGHPTYPGRTWNGHRIEGLLLNARMVQGIKRLLHEQIGMDWRERYDNEEQARATWLAAGDPREGFKDFLSRKPPA